MSNDENKWTCIGCGATIESSGKFCPYCGKDRTAIYQAPQVIQDPNVPVPAPIPVPIPPPMPIKKRSPLIPLVVVVVVFVVFFAIVYQGFFVIEGITKKLETGDGEYTYSWTYDGREYGMSLNISGAQYHYYADQEISRGFTTDSHGNIQYDYIDNFITYTDPTILKVAQNLNTLADKASLDALDTLGLALAFVQSIPYSYDIEHYGEEDYWAYPVETLVQDTGDCEDTGFLYASIAEALNTDAVIVAFEDHIAVGVANDDVSGTYYHYNGVDYYYCETTSSGWAIGEIPEDRGSAQIVQVGGLP